ncbi:ER membrane protein complex subunit 7 homolog [Rhagoletis pomonella]|uniref:ER membrane protein complex subunit 7 homolog n=1 Tax=Rhagoletis pomonella TaxID=28610 RepID=UPI00178537D5|nr:ER membrane protein complex subunit 7 homolog [Rhagoletis pomonella]
MIRNVIVCGVLALMISVTNGELVIGQDDLSEELVGLFTIEGRLFSPETQSRGLSETSLSINSGEYKGFLREDGSFIISSVPSGSYVLEVHHPDYYYEPIRVEINPKGKFRARKVNYVQPSQIIQVPYPLKMKALTRFKYFQTREQWKITDFLFSPMVLMMVLPLLVMLVLPKMINDPETKKEIENIQFPKVSNEMPEISEMITSFFSGAKPPEKEKKTVSSKQNKKRN